MHSLNDQQREAAEAIEGPLLVLSGAGTGKTSTLVSRISNIVTLDIKNSDKILAVTFTNKAARELLGRINALVPQNALQWVGTFHSVASRILRASAELIGLQPHFTIIDADDQISLLKTIIDEPLKKDKLKSISNTIQRWKDSSLTPDLVDPRNYYDAQVLSYYKEYQKRLQKSNSVDFGDLILGNILLFKNHPDVLKRYQETFKYIMVDEYQDSNKVQYIWLRMLAAGNENICCVGDDDQSIYGWRGADVNNILRFSQDFPSAKVIRLERNYRSTHHILESASNIIAHNNTRLAKKLWTTDRTDEKVKVLMFVDSNDEAHHVANTIRSLVQGDTSLDEIAILVRSSFQTRIFEEYLMKFAIPYKITGNVRFYDRKEIKDIIAYLRLVVNSNDDMAFERIVNVPRREFGDVSVQKVRLEAICSNQSMLEALSSMIDNGQIKKNRQLMRYFIDQIKGWRQLALDGTSVAELITTIAQESGYTEMLSLEEETSKTDNIKELAHAAAQFDDPVKFLQHISLVTDADEQIDKPMVNIMTLHAAKGLEFTCVFLPGWEEGSFPHQRALDGNEVEEERRLAYVGITRAKSKLYISSARRRFLGSHWQDLMPSRFLAELPPENIELFSAQNNRGAGQYSKYNRANSNWHNSKINS